MYGGEFDNNDDSTCDRGTGCDTYILRSSDDKSVETCLKLR